MAEASDHCFSIRGIADTADYCTASGSTDAVQVLGMGLKDNGAGRLEVTDGTLRFKSGKDGTAVSAICIDNVVTGRDSERVLLPKRTRLPLR